MLREKACHSGFETLRLTWECEGWRAFHPGKRWIRTRERDFGRTFRPFVLEAKPDHHLKDYIYRSRFYLDVVYHSFGDPSLALLVTDQHGVAVDLIGSPAINELCRKRGICPGAVLGLFTAGPSVISAAVSLNRLVALCSDEQQSPPWWGSGVASPFKFPNGKGIIAALAAGREPSGRMVNLVQSLIGLLSQLPVNEVIKRILNDESVEKPEPHQEVGRLTPRQKEVLHWMAFGYSYRGIAERLCISPETVRTLTRQIYDRLGVSSKVECLEMARALGLIIATSSNKPK